YWTEFNLVDASLKSATLVYEETVRGVEWRIFTMFDPVTPMTAAEAATKTLGDVVNLDGVDMPVTYVSDSHIYHVEGTAPEGEQVGSEANYFNLEQGSRMEVVSWTGEEVEFYHGATVSRSLVAAAFNLKATDFKLIIPKYNNYAGATSSTGITVMAKAL